MSNPMNPFSGWGAVEDASLFVGRDEICSQIWDYLQNGENIAIVGVCGVGKSSLLTLIEHRAVSHLGTSMHILRPPIALMKTHARAESILSSLLAKQLNSRGDLIKLIYKKHLLLLLDDLDTLAPNRRGWEVRKLLRSLSEFRVGGTRVQLIATSTVPLDVRFPESRDRKWGGSSLHGVLKRRINLPPFSKEEAKLFIEQMLGRVITDTHVSISDFADLFIEDQIPSRVWEICYSRYQQLHQTAVASSANAGFSPQKLIAIATIAPQQAPKSADLVVPVSSVQPYLLATVDLGIPPELVTRLRATLLKCGPFGSNEELQDVFSNALLAPWRGGVPERDTVIARVDSLINFLFNKWRPDTRINALVLFLGILKERIDQGDDCYGPVAKLTEELAIDLQE